MRGRGLKLICLTIAPAPRTSPPVRGRGLKLRFNFFIRPKSPVAPRAGAWIETGRYSHDQREVTVAPRAGAWIETPLSATLFDSLGRPPCGGVD